MEALVAIGLAGNVLTFIDFGLKIAKVTKEIHDSDAGATSSDSTSIVQTSRLKHFASAIQSNRQLVPFAQQDGTLSTIADECLAIATELEQALASVSSDQHRSKRAATKAAFRGLIGSKRSRIEGLEKQLDRCRQQLLLEIVVLDR